jgi:oxygen-independent coproporphyrinogen-3 oxidase
LFLLGVNRLSIGIQSLNDDVLEWMNRAHNSREALSSVKTAKKAGFNNISIDLIYGVPHKFNRDWQAELELIKDINIQHISAYSLTVEKRTALDYQIKKGLIDMLDDDGFSSEYEMMRNSLLEDNFMQYEVSNFCKQGFESKHNSSYWKSIPYLGIGPSAHSYDEKSRRWNVSNNNKYIVGVLSNNFNFQKEVLSNIDIANEIILTGTRTIYGFSKDRIINLLNNNQIDIFLSQVDKLIANNYLSKKNDIIKVNLKQNFLSDYIARELFVV